MVYYLKSGVDIIKYDGTNKEYIIDRLNINGYLDLYFKETPTYFIIPKDDIFGGDWFILNEKLYRDKIIEIK